jgi:hypothetical protein
VVHQPVDGGGSECFRHELVESGRVQVGADRHASFLVGGIYQAVEAFCGVGADRQQADVVDLCGCRHRSTYAGPATMPTRAVGSWPVP